MKKQKSSSTSILKFLKSTKKVQSGKEASLFTQPTKAAAVVNVENDRKNTDSKLNSCQQDTLSPSGLLALSARKEITSKPLESRKRKAMEEDESIPNLINTAPIVSKTVPAFQKYAPLLKQAKSKSGLPLPVKFEKLLLLFSSLETVINYMKSRDTIPILHKIIKSVEHQAAVRFEVKHFQMIVAVYPEAYVLSSVNAVINDDSIPSVSIELPQTPTLPLPTLSPAKGADSKSQSLSAVQKFISQIPIRRQEFQKRLEKLVKDEHAKYLQENKIESFQFDKITPNWHPGFNLESVKDINLAPLPIKKRESYLDLLKKRNNIYATPSKEKSLQLSSPEVSLDENNKQEGLKTPPPTPTEAGKPMSRSKALLERIREKQRLKSLAPPPDPAIAKKRGMLLRIRSIASSLSMHAKTNGKSVLSVKEAISHLAHSFPEYYLDDSQWYEHLQLLVETVPNFCTMEVMINCKHLSVILPQHYLLRFGKTGLKSVQEKIESLTSP